ncbi:Putative protein of unknown function [Podospora comata]|uniref:Uncharacterized protein n=1 Tax=Podospora comata TaxID=48703 RepID=A0ABY6RUE0_PODCO|nr:Putative protein of unknown function [Podospora comata]
MPVHQPPNLAALADATSSALHTRRRTPPYQIFKFDIPNYKPPSSPAAVLPPAIQKLVSHPKKPPFNYPPRNPTQPTHPQPPNPSPFPFGSTPQEIDTFFLSPSPGQDPQEEYVLSPPPQGEPPRPEAAKVKMGKMKWLAGYAVTSPCELPGPVKQTVVEEESGEVLGTRWVGVKVEKEMVDLYVPEWEDFDSDCEGYSEREGGVTPKGKGKGVGGDEVGSEAEGIVRQRGGRKKMMGTIKRFGRSLVGKRKPRAGEGREQTSVRGGKIDRDQTPGPHGARGYKGRGTR